MSDRELRELDAWIGVHLFGWVKTNVKCHPTDNRTIGGRLYSPNGFDGDLNQSSCVPSYTTDPAAAMRVLGKCIECRSVVTNKEPTGRVSVVELKMGALGLLHTAGAVTADTLPLAICLFARKLFSK